MQKPRLLPLLTIWLVCALGTFGDDAVGTVTARPATVQSVPVGGEHTVLFVDDHAELHAATAPSGIAAFAVKSNVAIDGSILRFVFPGDDDHQASITVQQLHVKPPAVATKQLNELAQSALERPVLVLSLPQLEPRLRDSPPRTAIRQMFTDLQVPSDFTTYVPVAGVPTSTSDRMYDSAAGSLSAADIAQYMVRDLTRQPWGAGLLILASVLVAAPALHLAGRRREIRFPASLGPGALFAAIPMPARYAMRVATFGMAVGLTIALVLRPETGLFLFRHVLIPVLPLLYFLDPALWRKVRPIAALNQAQRVFHYARGLPTPRWLQNYSYAVAASLVQLLRRPGRGSATEGKLRDAVSSGTGDHPRHDRRPTRGCRCCGGNGCRPACRTSCRASGIRGTS
jgi:hypothetical protein